MTITQVASQAGGADGLGTTSITRAYPANVTAGNLVTVVTATNGTTAPVLGDCIKSAGTATLGTGILHRGTLHTVGSQAVGIWSFIVTASGSLTMQVTSTSGAFLFIATDELNSTVGWDSSRAEASNSGEGTTATAINSGNATSAGAAYFAGAVAVENSALITFTRGSGWNLVYEAVDGGSREVGQYIFKIVSGGTTDAANTTISAAPARWIAGVAVIREVSIAVAAEQCMSSDLYF